MHSDTAAEDAARRLLCAVTKAAVVPPPPFHHQQRCRCSRWMQSGDIIAMNGAGNGLVLHGARTDRPRTEDSIASRSRPSFVRPPFLAVCTVQSTPRGVPDSVYVLGLDRFLKSSLMILWVSITNCYFEGKNLHVNTNYSYKCSRFLSVLFGVEINPELESVFSRIGPSLQVHVTSEMGKAAL